MSWMWAQEIPLNKHKLPVVQDVHLYKQLIQKDSSHRLVDLQKFLPGLKIDIRYATANNFTHTVLYPSARVFACYNVAVALREIRAELKPLGLDIKIYDAYRPYAITEKMWECVKDDRYAADPAKGSRHNRGCAIDLTLINTKTGREVPMPTPYDDFSNKAHDNYTNLPPSVIKNRALLRGVMEKHGFSHITSEWWHFDFQHWATCPLLNLSFKELDSINN